MALLEIKNLSFSFGEKQVLNNINLSLEAGEFAVLTGPTGSGKSTLLKVIKKELGLKGKITGEIIFEGYRREELPAKEALKIGLVLQKPENQIVTAKVYHELAFGLENMGLPREEIESRIGELSSFFGIDSWFWKDTFALSGGQKQILALASVMAAGPSLLLLDEPTSELDPIAAEQFISLLQKLNQELGIAVLLVEHRLDSVLKLADRLIVMEAGKIISEGKPGPTLASLENPKRIALPSAAKIFLGLGGSGSCPLTVKEGADFLNKYLPQTEFSEIKAEKFGKNVIEISNLWFAYQRFSEVLKGADLEVSEGEIIALTGGNGSGKSTLLKLLSGLYQPLQGKISLFGQNIKTFKKQELYSKLISYLPQNPQDLFLEERVADEIGKGENAEKLLSEFELTTLAEEHPYDLSGGEQQRLGMAKILKKDAKILLLDEPTKGLDPYWKGKLIEILKNLKKTGVTAIIATHDLDFAARVSDRVGLLFGGRIQALAAPKSFFTKNTFYTTAANRIARKLYPEALTEEEVIGLAKKYGERNENN